MTLHLEEDLKHDQGSNPEHKNDLDNEYEEGEIIYSTQFPNGRFIDIIAENQHTYAVGARGFPFTFINIEDFEYEQVVNALETGPDAFINLLNDLDVSTYDIIDYIS